jgi:hypothetical protein
MRWATAPSYTVYVLDAVGSAGLHSQARNEFPGKFVAHNVIP